MTMLPELKFSEARSKFTEVVDRAQRFEIPIIRPRKQSEDFNILLRGDLLKSLLSPEQEREFTAKVFREDDGSVTISVDPLDIVVNAGNLEAAIQAAAQETAEYAREYLDPENFPLYSRSPNRRPHLALVVKTLLCESPERVKELIGLA